MISKCDRCKHFDAAKSFCRKIRLAISGDSGCKWFAPKRCCENCWFNSNGVCDTTELPIIQPLADCCQSFIP